MDNLDAKQFDVTLKSTLKDIANNRGAPFGITAIQRKLIIGFKEGGLMIEAALKRELIVVADKPYLYNLNF